MPLAIVAAASNAAIVCFRASTRVLLSRALNQVTSGRRSVFQFKWRFLETRARAHPPLLATNNDAEREHHFLLLAAARCATAVVAANDDCGRVSLARARTRARVLN